MKSAYYLLMVFFAAMPGCSDQGSDADAYGNFEAVEVIVSAETQGRILRFEAGEGALLQKEQLIVLIDSTQLYLKKRQLRSGTESVYAKIGTVDAQVSASRIQLDNLEREKERIGRLYEGGAATSKQLDDINGQVALLEAQVEASVTQKATLRAELNTLEVQIEQLDDQLKRCYVRSPEEGTLLSKFKEEGEVTGAGQPLFKMANLDALILRAYLSGDQLGLIKLGQQVVVKYDMPSGTESVEGIVEWVSPRAEFTPKIIQTREERVNLVYAVKILVPNDGKLKIGMPGELFLK